MMISRSSSKCALRVPLVLALAVAAVAAQEKPQQPQQPPTFRTGVNLVRVDAYPSRDGKIVEGLTAADFEVFEDGRPQRIDAFEFVRLDAGARDPFFGP